jgi:alpha-tubulin suppressor-like RCC1 family protein
MVPTKIKFSKAIVDISIGNDFGLILTKEGRVYSWGINEASQIG